MLIDPAADHLAIVALAICYQPTAVGHVRQIYSAGYPDRRGADRQGRSLHWRRLACVACVFPTWREIKPVNISGK